MRLGFSNRIILASLFAPLSILVFVPVSDFLLTLKDGAGQSLHVSWRLALVLLPYAYVLTLVLGVPSFLFLRSRNLSTMWAAAAIGFLAVWIIPILMAFLFSTHDLHPRTTYWAYAFSVLRLASAITFIIAPIGALVGVVFWVIGRTP